MTSIDLSGLDHLLYRGNVNTWECDEMGHMNVRFYVQKTQEALGVLGHMAGLGPTHLRTTGTALTVTDHHIRFLNELRAGAGIYAVGGIVAGLPHGFRAYIELRDSLTHTPSATFNTVVEQRDPDMGARIPLPDRVRSTFPHTPGQIPDHAQPRGIQITDPDGTACMARAEELGMPVIGQGMVLRSQCNENDLMHTQHFIGRISDGVINFLPTLRPEKGEYRDDGKTGSAVVEYRVCYHARPRAGDIVMVRSGLKAVSNRTMHLVHWVLDGVTGAALATSEAIGVTLDLEARKSVPLPDDVRTHMESKVIKGLSV